MDDRPGVAKLSVEISAMYRVSGGLSAPSQLKINPVGLTPANEGLSGPAAKVAVETVGVNAVGRSSRLMALTRK